MRPWAIVVAALCALLIGGAGVLADQVGGRPARAEAWSPPADPTAAGPVVVALSAEARRHPRAAEVALQLQIHYGAINTRDHREWSRTVTQARFDLVGAEQFQAMYRSTQDGSMLVERIDSRADGSVLVRVRFISVQDEVDAPSDLPVQRICWRSTLPMAAEPGLDLALRIDVTGGASSISERC